VKDFDNKLYKILKESKFIKEAALEAAYKSSKDMARSLADVLLFRGLISEESLTQLMADYLKVPFISLKMKVIPDEILNLVPETLARTYRMIPFGKRDKTIQLAMEDPENFEAIEVVKRRTALEVSPYLSSKVDLNRALNQYKRDIKKKFESIVTENVKKATTTDGVNLEGLVKIAQELPVVKILDALLEYAVAENASDLHFETLQESLLIRLRIDGVLHDIIDLPKEVQPAIVARIKVLANLKIDEHRIPQDGRFKFQMDEVFIALRVSIVPAFFGENVVLRILPESTRPLSLEELGISGTNLELVQKNIKRPNGMILVTGPTGCGKTTTLYSILNILNSPEIKICTVEDPIEYGVARVSQIQVNPQAGLTFATGLRSLLRHDPDVIMVGEIRDNETTNVAIHSALTGHLVLSTLHTNDAPSQHPSIFGYGGRGLFGCFNP
jgi:type IV pilus assembly protein PilB